MIFWPHHLSGCENIEKELSERSTNQHEVCVRVYVDDPQRKIPWVGCDRSPQFRLFPLASYPNRMHAYLRYSPWLSRFLLFPFYLRLYISNLYIFRTKKDDLRVKRKKKKKNIKKRERELLPFINAQCNQRWEIKNTLKQTCASPLWYLLN